MEEISHLIWKVLSEYIPNRDHETAAHHLVNELVDAGINEDDLYAMAAGNVVLRRAVKELVEIDEDDDDDYEEL
jgi:hypothetical protein